MPISSAESHKIMSALEQGIVPGSTKSRLLELEAKRDACKLSLNEQGDHPPVAALHSRLSEVYRRKAAELETALNDPSIQPEASGVLRGLIDAMVLHPGDRRGEVRGVAWRDRCVDAAGCGQTAKDPRYGNAGLVGCGERI